jgi:hypothetical protein
MANIPSGSLPPKITVTPTPEQVNAENEQNNKIKNNAQNQVNILKSIFK